MNIYLAVFMVWLVCGIFNQMKIYQLKSDKVDVVIPIVAWVLSPILTAGWLMLGIFAQKWHFIETDKDEDV